jgi:putative hydrolase of the HAD superfamily
MGYESGKITTDEFLALCIKGMNLKMNADEFAEAFNNMFYTIEPMQELVRSLAAQKKYRLFLLSNTSELHFDHIKKNYEFVNLLDEFGLSYKLKSLKPDEVIYRRAVELFNARPDESVFIDDIKANCEGAERIGVRTIQYDQNNHEAFVRKFEEIINQKI